MNRTHTIIIGIIVLLIIGAGAYAYMQKSGGYSYTLAQGEHIADWHLQGAYTGNADLEKKANDEITRLRGLLSNKKDAITDYTLYISIANQYHLLGDGKDEYEYLMQALAIDSTTTGLAWENLGVLLEQTGAPKSARDAYAHAAAAQPQIVQYQAQYLDFLTNHFKDNTAEIEAAFANAQKTDQTDLTLLQIRARWLEGTGRTTEAIAVWKNMRALSPESSASIDAEIKRLQAL